MHMLNLKFIILLIIINCSLSANNSKLPFELEVKKDIKSLLNNNYEDLLISKKNLNDYYVKNDYSAYWIDKNGIKSIGLSLINRIKNDPVLKPHINKIFRLDEVEKNLNSLDKSDSKYLEKIVKIDFMLTELFDRYVTYISKGSIKWNEFEEKLAEREKQTEIKATWDKYSLKEDPKQLLKKVVEKNDLLDVLNGLDFNYPQVKELISAIDELEKISANGGYTKVPESKSLRIGDVSEVLPILRKRLAQSKDLNTQCENTQNEQSIINDNTNTINTSTEQENSENVKLRANCENIFDEDLKNAVISFQKKHGLFADGIVGTQTQRFINISASKKIAIIRLNLERMRWLPRNLGEKYLLVNIPEYRLKLYENDEVKLNMAVIVGDAKFPTPIFSDKMSYVVLNPNWNIPDSIAKNELIPKLLKDPNYLADKGIDIYAGWNGGTEKIDSKDVLDSAILQDEEYLKSFRFSQNSNKDNPLGKMKFMFPNKHAVYLHDTPAKYLFANARRAFSHGCIRLSKPQDLLTTIADEDSNLDIDKANDILANVTSEKAIGLNKKIPIHIVYLTSWVDENGVLQFREDIYNFDKLQKEFLL
ncbi:murein L,D-transpeptidase, YcbB/YkuD family [Arcobacter venerupis]|uniref:Murein L,D-transpeptidase, YcbB/YkuD family n=2 Tax=Arcobacter venerupis TaxID=1054033 RepID=A0AAE7E4Y6_9BACT|nr:murein L,D-transpeptidase, YcbB/YkuD family [Arcobacter venerupis]